MSKPRTPPIYTSPQDAALAFYQAFEAKDIDGMMTAWADDEEIVSIHPGGARHVGYDAVRGAFEQLFAGDAKLTFRLEQVVLMETVGLAAQSAGVRPAARRTDRCRARRIRGVDCAAPLVIYIKTKCAPSIGAALRGPKNAGIVPAAAIRDSSTRADVQPAAFNTHRPN